MRSMRLVAIAAFRLTGQAAAPATQAMEQQDLVLVRDATRQALAQFTQGEVDRVGHMPFAEFFRRADIDDKRALREVFSCRFLGDE